MIKRLVALVLTAAVVGLFAGTTFAAPNPPIRPMTSDVVIRPTACNPPIRPV